MSFYYSHFQANTMNPCSWIHDDRPSITWECKGCGHPKPGTKALDAHIQERRPSGLLNFVFGYALPVARKSFLMQFGEERVRRDLYVGQVYGPDGELLEDWLTFRGKKGLIVRGTREAGFRTCEDCGRILYFAMGRKYLYQVPSREVELFESNAYGLIVPEHIAREFVTVKSRGFRAERLEVLEKPLDGLSPLEFLV